MTAFPVKSSGVDKSFSELLMQLHEEIQQHLVRLEPRLQAEVLDFVLFLEQKQQESLGKPAIDDEEALNIHAQLMDQYADAFAKLAQ